MTPQSTMLREGDGRLADAAPAAQDALGILPEGDNERGGLIALLERIQRRYGYLPETALRAVSEKTGRALVEIYGLATFYRSFSLQPRGKHLICACLGTACHVRASLGVVEEFQRQLGIPPGQTTPDQQFTLETVNCLGACALGPVVVIDGQYFSKVRKRQVRGLLDDTLAGRVGAKRGAPVQILPLEVRCSRCNHSLMDPGFPIDDRPSIRVSIAVDSRYGWLRLSSWYGSDHSSAEHEIPTDRITSFFCPHCHAELNGDCLCAECDAPMVALLVHGGGALQLCSRRGCPSRRLDLL